MHLFKDIITSMRIPHWLKNVIIFIPMISNHGAMNESIFLNLLQTFFLFSLMSSAIYIINDLIDIPFDQIQPINKNRPISKHSNKNNKWIFASTAAILLLAVLLYTFYFSQAFFILLVLYFFLNLIYSFIFKKTFILDVVILAFFLIFRLKAGEAIYDSIMPFKYYVGFFPFFLALGFLKRYTEINSNHRLYKRSYCPGRPYRLEHSGLVWNLSWILSLISLVIFINIFFSALLMGNNNFTFLFLFLFMVNYSRKLWLNAKNKKINGDITIYAINEIF